MTDNRTYVTWFSSDSTEPFTHDIAPGAFLDGFALGSPVLTSEELPFAVMSWEHGATDPGPSEVGEVTVPSVTSVAATLADLKRSGSDFQFTIIGISTLEYAVEVSSDLQTWTEVVTGLAPFTFRGSISEGHARFFRVTYVDLFSTDFDDPDAE